MVRLNKYLADCGIAARRKCDTLISYGRISVNGVIERRLGTKVDEQADEVRFDNKLLKSKNEFVYFLLNKPKGVVTTVSDEKKRKTVMDFVETKRRVFPVGRLDSDTSGLLLLTDDGDLAYRLTHPRFEIDKTYEIRLDRALRLSDKSKLEKGIKLEEGITSPCKIEIPKKNDPTLLRMTIHQGWNRQIRRMFAKLKYQIVSLNRIAIASLAIKGVKSGQVRVLSHKEIERLRSIVSGN